MFCLTGFFQVAMINIAFTSDTGNREFGLEENGRLITFRTPFRIESQLVAEGVCEGVVGIFAAGVGPVLMNLAIRVKREPPLTSGRPFRQNNTGRLHFRPSGVAYPFLGEQGLGFSFEFSIRGVEPRIPSIDLCVSLGYFRGRSLLPRLRLSPDVIDVKAGDVLNTDQRKNLACIAKHLQLISMSKGVIKIIF